MENISQESEPHKIICCARCGEAKKLEFRRSGDNELYYRCESCGFESEPFGQAPYWVQWNENQNPPNKKLSGSKETEKLEHGIGAKLV